MCRASTYGMHGGDEDQAVLAGGLAANKYVQALFQASKTYPRICSALIVVFSYLFSAKYVVTLAV